METADNMYNVIATLPRDGEANNFAVENEVKVSKDYITNVTDSDKRLDSNLNLAN